MKKGNCSIIKLNTLKGDVKISGGEMTESKRNKQKLWYAGAVICVMVAMAAVLCLLFNGKETKISDNSGNNSISVLDCKASSPVVESFFEAKDAINNEHEIKITYQGNRVDKVSYTYTADFPSGKEADEANAVLHAKYNNYMAQYSLDPAKLGPTFTVVDNNFKINLFTDMSKIDPAMMGLFFLDNEDIGLLESGKIESLKKIYFQKGFNCNSQ